MTIAQRLAVAPTVAIATREFASFFRTPLGWVVAALLLFLSGMVFSAAVLNPGSPASMRDFFSLWWYLLLTLAPAISMRLFSEEIRSGTIEPLMSGPVPEIGVVIGKYAGAVLFLLTCLAPTLAYPLLLEALSRPDWGPILAGYLGVVLVGMLYLAVGTLCSVLTASQTLAFLATLFALILIEVASRQGGRLPAPWDGVLHALSIEHRVVDFARGIVDTAHIVYFLVTSGLSLALCALVLRVRRWR